MRIGIDTHFITSTKVAGGRTYTAELVQALISLDNQNEYVLYAEQDHPYYCQFKDNPRVRVRRVLPHNGLIRNFICIPWFAAQDDLDILHLQYFLPWFIPAPTVLVVHDLYYMHAKNPSSYEKILGRLMVWSAKRSKHIITLSEYSRQDIISHCSVNSACVTAIPLAAHPRFSPVKSHTVVLAIKERLGIERDYILFIGRTDDSRKNILTLVDAYAQLIARGNTNIQLVIAGRHGPQTEIIKQRIRDLGLEKKALLPGVVSDEDLPGLISGAQIFVFASSFEGFGLPVLEAMACGTPAITSNATSLPEVAGEAALQVKPGDVGELLDAMIRLLEDDFLRNDLRNLGLKRAALFSWEFVARETLKIYELLAA